MSTRHVKFLCSTALLWSGLLSPALAQSALVPPAAPSLWRTATISQPPAATAEDTQVAIALGVISVPESFWERMSVDFALDAKALANDVAFLSDIQVHQFMGAIQGDARTNVMAAPKLTTLDGRPSGIAVGETQVFVTGVDVRWTGEQMLAVPRSEPYHIGLKANFVPRVTADRRFVCLNMDTNLSSLDSAVAPLSPVTSMITPIFEGGAQGQPVSFTQYVQQPRISRITVNKTLCIPDGGTALLLAGKRTGEGAGQFGPPVLSKIPYVNKLFKNAAQTRETECVLFMVTPRIISSEQEETRPPAERHPHPQKAVAAKPAATDSDVEESECLTAEKCSNAGCPSCRSAHLRRLIEEYRSACAAGKVADARRLAADALSIDPTCFSKGK